MYASKSKAILEMVILFVGAPLLFYFDLLPGFWKILPLFLFFAYCLGMLLRNKKFSTWDFQLKNTDKNDWARLLIFPVVLFLALTVRSPENVFADFSNKRVLISIFTYPFLSVFPQEIIYRKFYYYRYTNTLHSRILLITLNTVLFSFAHIYFRNHVALLLTLIGGMAFTFTYLRTKSLLFVCIEHSVYGLSLLCSGLSPYFFKAF